MSTYIKLESAKNKIIEIKTRIFGDLDQYNWLEIAEIIFNEINSLPSIDEESIKYSKAFDVFSEYINFNKSKIIELDKLLYWILERKSEELDKNINESKKRIKKLKSETSNKLPK